MNLSSLIPLAPRIFDLFDNNRDGTVDMREIICGISSLKNSQGDDALRLCFQVSEPKYPTTEILHDSFLVHESEIFWHNKS